MPSCAPQTNPKSLICTVKEIRQWTDYYDNPWFYHNLLCQLTLKDSETSCWRFGYCKGWEVTDGKVGVSFFRCGLYSEWVTIDLGTEKWKWGGTFYDWTEWFTLSMLLLGLGFCGLLNLRKYPRKEWSHWGNSHSSTKLEVMEVWSGEGWCKAYG